MAKIKDLVTGNPYIDGYIDAWESNVDIALNKSRAHAAVYLRRNNDWNGDTYTSHFWRKLLINGTTVFEIENGVTIPPKVNGYVKVAEGFVDVTHDTDGKKSVTITFSGADNIVSSPTGFDIQAQSGTLKLTDIPRYATVSQSLSSKGINTVTINWSSDSTIDHVWYDLQGDNNWRDAGSVNTSSGSYTISNVSDNTTYWIRTKVRRKDNQLESISGDLEVKTYDYAKITSAPNFNDEENPTITYSNPYGNNVDSLGVEITKTTGTTLVGYKWDISKTSDSYTFNLTSEDRKKLRQECTGTSLPVRFYIRTESNGEVYWDYLERTMTIVNGAPIFTDFEWEITNYSELTGNNDTVIKGFSSVKTKISNTNKAVAKKEAAIQSYKTVIGTKNKISSSLNYPVEMTVNNVDGTIVSVFANDSRGNSTKVEKSISNYIDLTALSIDLINVTRSPNNDEEVVLQVQGVVDTVDFGLVTNAINRSRYYYKHKESNSYIEGSTNLQFTYEKITRTQHKFFINQTIEGDIEDGFSSNGEYDIKVTISDKLTEVTKETSLEQGSPAIAILGNNVALGGPYNPNVGGRVQVNGDLTANGNLTANEIHRNGLDYLASFSDTIPNADANDYTRSGMYYLGSNAKNAPASAWVKLYVNGTGSSSSDVSQLAITFGNEVYFRLRNGANWGSWQRIPSLEANGNLSIAGIMNVENELGYLVMGNCVIRFNGTNTVVAGSSGGSIYFRPNGEGNDTGRMLLTSEGKLYLREGTLEVAGAKSLYTNTSGSNGTITLSESSANFGYLDIFFKDNTGIFSSVRVQSPHGKIVSLTSIETTDNYSYFMNIKTANIKVSGTSITRTNYKETNINSGGGVSCASSNSIYITKVLGYK